MQDKRVLRLAANFIKPFEGFCPTPYQDTAGVWTIGYGHIEHTDANGVTIDGKHHRRLTRQQSLVLLENDLNRYYFPPVKKTFPWLNTYQAAATVSFVYNCGVGMLQESHDFGRWLHQHKPWHAAQSLLEYDKDIAGHTLTGLERRRKAEQHLFLMHVLRAYYHKARAKPKSTNYK